ncbi:hypothetical protein Tco_0120615 [Tanacetum coccineum]
MSSKNSRGFVFIEYPRIINLVSISGRGRNIKIGSEIIMRRNEVSKSIRRVGWVGKILGTSTGMSSTTSSSLSILGGIESFGPGNISISSLRESLSLTGIGNVERDSMIVSELA